MSYSADIYKLSTPHDITPTRITDCTLSFFCLQTRQRPHQFRKVLATGQTGDGVHYVETGGLPVREERQSRVVPPHYAGAQRERLIHFVLFI